MLSVVNVLLICCPRYSCCCRCPVQPCFLSSDFPVLFSSSKNFLTSMTIFWIGKSSVYPVDLASWQLLWTGWTQRAQDVLISPTKQLYTLMYYVALFMHSASIILHQACLSPSLEEVCATLSVCRRLTSTCLDRLDHEEITANAAMPFAHAQFARYTRAYREPQNVNLT